MNKKTREDIKDRHGFNVELVAADHQAKSSYLYYERSVKRYFIVDSEARIPYSFKLIYQRGKFRSGRKSKKLIWQRVKAGVAVNCAFCNRVNLVSRPHEDMGECSICPYCDRHFFHFLYLVDVLKPKRRKR